MSPMSTREFARLSRFIHSHLGIKMPPEKKTMLQSRLQPRLRELGLNSFQEYCAYFFSEKGKREEAFALVDVVTTNKTDYFRGKDHFDYLDNNILTEWVHERLNDSNRLLRVWSAGCSSGEEAYTLAIVLKEAEEKTLNASWKFNILATDVSQRVLKQGKNAVYTKEVVQPIPLPLLKKYFLQGKGSKSNLFRVVPRLRERVKFNRVNFAEHNFKLRDPMDIIFCRNVMIYFDKTTQAKLLQRFCDHLRPGGYLFIGHTETLHGFELPVEMVYPTVYRKHSPPSNATDHALDTEPTP